VKTGIQYAAELAIYGIPACAGISKRAINEGLAGRKVGGILAAARRIFRLSGNILYGHGGAAAAI
jgi:hypothetical protein